MKKEASLLHGNNTIDKSKQIGKTPTSGQAYLLGDGGAIGTGTCGLLAACVKFDILSGRHTGVCVFLFF